MLTLYHELCQENLPVSTHTEYVVNKRKVQVQKLRNKLSFHILEIMCRAATNALKVPREKEYDFAETKLYEQVT